MVVVVVVEDRGLKRQEASGVDAWAVLKWRVLEQQHRARETTEAYSVQGKKVGRTTAGW